MFAQNCSRAAFFFFFQHSAAGKDDLAVFWIWIKFNDLEAVGVAYKGFDVVNVFGVEMRCWHEAACTDIYDNAAFDIANNPRFDDFAVFKFLLKFIHSFFLISTLLGENHVTFVVFHLNDHNLNFIANFNDVFDIWIFWKDSSLIGITPSDLPPTSTITSSGLIFTTVPVTHHRD